MSAANIGPNIGLNGVDQYKQDLEMAKAATKAFKAELESFGKIKEPFAKAVGQTSALEKEIAAQQIAIKGLTEKYGEAVNKYGQYSKQAFKAQEELAKANKALSAMIDEYKGLSTAKITIPGVGEFKRDIETLTQSTKTFKSEFQAITSGFGIEGAFKRASDSSKSLNDAIKVQKETITVLKEEYDKTAAEQGEFSQGAMEMREKVANATVELNNMEKTLRDLPNGFQAAGQAIVENGNYWKSLGDEITQAAKPLNVFSGVYAAGVAVAVKASAEYEGAMDRVKSVLEQNTKSESELAEQMDAINEKIMNTSSIMSKSEMAAGFENITRAGFGGVDALKVFDSAMNIAIVEEMNMEAASNGLARALLSFGDGTENAAHYADVLAITSARSATNVTELYAAMDQAQQYAGALASPIEDVSLMMGLMANNGIVASRSGTILKNVFANLTNPTAQAAEELDKFNVSLYDAATGNALPLRNVMDQLRSSFGNVDIELSDLTDELLESEEAFERYAESLPYTQQEKLRAIVEVFGKRALPGVLAVINTAEEDYLSLADAIDNASGTAAQMAETVSSGTAAQFKQLKEDAIAVAISFGEQLLPILKQGIEVASGWVEKFKNMDEGTKKFILTAGGVVALIGPILTGIGGITSGIGTLIGSGGHLLSGIGGIVRLIGGAGAAGGGGLIASLGGLVAAAGPVVIAIAAVAGVALLIYKNWDTVGPFLAKTWEGIKTNASNIWNGIKNFFIGTWEGIKTNTENIWNGIKTFVSGTWNGIKTNATNIYNGIKTFISGTWNGIKTNTSNIWNGIKSFITTIVTGISNTVKTAFNNVKTGIQNAWNAVKTATENVWNAVKDIAKTITDTIKGLVDSAFSWGADLVNNIASGIANSVGNVITAVSNVANEIASRLHFSVPDKGPLANADTYMPDFMRLLASGMRSGIGMLNAASNDVAKAIAPDFYMDLPEAGSSTTTNMGGVNIVINAQPGQDVYELADIVEERISSLMERREAAYA